MIFLMSKCEWLILDEMIRQQETMNMTELQQNI